MPLKEARRVLVSLPRVPELRNMVKKLTREIKALRRTPKGGRDAAGRGEAD